MRIFDCSNSTLRPEHRGFGGPVHNDIMRYLAKYAPMFGAEFVTNISNADVAITNDVFTPDVMASGLPRVKRMDGIFSRQDLIDRNSNLNEAAVLADHVIFISDYSKASFHILYPNLTLKAESVALNVADPEEFSPIPFDISSPKDINHLVWGCSATNWHRPEKRFEAILMLSKLLPADNQIMVLGDNRDLEGKGFNSLPDNVSVTGYLADYTEYSAHLEKCDVFANFSYKDPAPKTVCQAIACGLPVLFADSGGTGEIVQNCGIAIPEKDFICFEKDIPPISEKSMQAGLSSMLESLQTGRAYSSFLNRSIKAEFHQMLESYFSALNRAVSNVEF